MNTFKEYLPYLITAITYIGERVQENQSLIFIPAAIVFIVWIAGEMPD